MLKKLLAPLSYYIIKSYRVKHISRPFSYNTFQNSIINNPDEAAAIISNVIVSDLPCMISRFGNNELDTTLNYRKGHPLSFLRTIYPFWVSDNSKSRMQVNAGFFPNNNKNLSLFADLIVSIVNEIDILGVWVGTEDNLNLSEHCKRINLDYLGPFWSKNPWTAKLKGNNVLVVHPFEESIKRQYERRKLLFENKDTLPEFSNLYTIKAIQSIGGNDNGFETWFDALHFMEEQIDGFNYDVALIGCGAYGMPLAAHCKQQGKKAVHLGGILQMLFGILGKRWETEQKQYLKFTNKYWVHPLENEKPKSAQNVEDACYW